MYIHMYVCVINIIYIYLYIKISFINVYLLNYSENPVVSHIFMNISLNFALIVNEKVKILD